MTLANYREHQAFFNTKAATWETAENQIPFLRQLGELIGLKGYETVLDIGCGTGSLFEFLDEYLPDGKIIGVDFAYNMLRRCRHDQSSKRFRLQSLAEQLPIADCRADIVLNYCLYPHIKFKHAALREFHRVLKPAGKYYIIHPLSSEEVNAIHNRIGGVVCYDFIEPVESVVALLKINGFKVLRAVDRADRFFIESVKM